MGYNLETQSNGKCEFIEALTKYKNEISQIKNNKSILPTSFLQSIRVRSYEMWQTVVISESILFNLFKTYGST